MLAKNEKIDLYLSLKTDIQNRKIVMERLFMELDSDKDSHLNFRELSKFMTDITDLFGEVTSEKDIQRVMEKFNESKTKKLNYNEFYNVFMFAIERVVKYKKDQYQ